MNTAMEYLYRDADNYKSLNRVVLKGQFTQAQSDVIYSCLDKGEYFIPRQIGLPEKRFDTFDPQSDHCWFELHPGAFTFTNQEPTIELSIEDLTQNFQKAKGNWDETCFPGEDVFELNVFEDKTTPEETNSELTNEELQGISEALYTLIKDRCDQLDNETDEELRETIQDQIAKLNDLHAAVLLVLETRTRL